MKENPNYKNYSQRLIQRNNLDFKKINEDVISKDDNNSLVPKNNTENIIYTKKKNGEERQNNRLKLYDEELDNSSFSLDEKTRKEIVQNVSNKKVKKIRNTGAVLIRNDANGGKYLYDIKSQKNQRYIGYFTELSCWLFCK